MGAQKNGFGRFCAPRASEQFHWREESKSGALWGQ